MSYLEHFKLNEPPFRLTPDPDFVYWSKQHARAKAYMESTIWLAEGFVVITGEIGSGKTTLLQSFLAELDDSIVYAVVSQTQLNAKEFLQAVLTEFGFKPFDKEKVELLDILNVFLIEQYSNRKKVVLIVDEAQNLSRKVLEEIRMLSGIETHKEKVLRIILAGQPELKGTLELPELKQLLQRVRLRFHIGPLDRNEMREYIGHRLSIAGRTANDLFDASALECIYRYCGGVPRLINTLCDTALLCAFTDDKEAISEPEITAAAKELDWKQYEYNTDVLRQVARPVFMPAAIESIAQIEVRCDGESLETLSFAPGRVIIGRSPDNEIYIDSEFISRHHAQIVSDERGAFIEDLNSTNGVFVGGQQIKKYQLRDGDIISLGVNELVYRDLRVADASVGDEQPSAIAE